MSGLMIFSRNNLFLGRMPKGVNGPICFVLSQPHTELSLILYLMCTMEVVQQMSPSLPCHVYQNNTHLMVRGWPKSCSSTLVTVLFIAKRIKVKLGKESNQRTIILPPMNPDPRQFSQQHLPH